MPHLSDETRNGSALTQLLLIAIAMLLSASAATPIASINMACKTANCTPAAVTQQLTVAELPVNGPQVDNESSNAAPYTTSLVVHAAGILAAAWILR